MLAQAHARYIFSFDFFVRRVIFNDGLQERF